MDTIPASDPMQNPPQKPLGGLDPVNLLKQVKPVTFKGNGLSRG